MTLFVRRLAMVVVTALSLSAIGLPAFAQQEVAPEHLALARKYIDLTDRANVYESALVNTAVETMHTMVAQKPDISTALETAITKTIDTYKDRKGELLDQFARLYAARFTMDELQQIVAFYESPVGMKLSSTTGQINNDLQTVLQIWQSNLRTEFFAKVKAELKAEGVDL